MSIYYISSRLANQLAGNLDPQQIFFHLTRRGTLKNQTLFWNPPPPPEPVVEPEPVVVEVVPEPEVVEVIPEPEPVEPEPVVESLE